MLGVTVFLISRLRAMFWVRFPKPGLSAEVQETGSKMWGSRVREAQKDRSRNRTKN